MSLPRTGGVAGPTWAEEGGGVSAAVRTHPGRVRELNEDRYVFAPSAGVLGVIDGMGGEAAGEVAAQITAETVLAQLQDTPASPGEAARRALHEANVRVRARAASSTAERGMGCVASIAVVEGEALYVAHVGDTRAYVASDGGCQQLTRDHTALVEETERGATEADLAHHRDLHKITRDIGAEDHAHPGSIDLVMSPFEEGDLLLLSSDGLHDLVTDRELFGLLSEARRERTSVTQLVDTLVELALERGGHDNITVVVARRLRPRPVRYAPEPAPAPRSAANVTDGEGTEKVSDGGAPPLVPPPPSPRPVAPTPPTSSPRPAPEPGESDPGPGWALALVAVVLAMVLGAVAGWFLGFEAGLAQGLEDAQLAAEQAARDAIPAVEPPAPTDPVGDSGQMPEVVPAADGGTPPP